MLNSKNNARSYASSASKVTYDAGLRAYMLSVYNYMAVALGISGAVALFVASSPTLLNAIFGTGLKYIFIFAPLAFVFYFSAKIHSMSDKAAKNSLFIFAALMGVSLSTVFIAYTGASIARTFFITASTFGAMSLYGYTTKKDLSGFGSFLIMGLIGLIIASIVNLFMQSAAFEFAISAIGVLIFTGLTAYDTQKIKRNYLTYGGGENGVKMAVMGALNLYMDFINLFLMMLRFMGDRR
jgi:hypothetical protein